MIIYADTVKTFKVQWYCLFLMTTWKVCHVFFSRACTIMFIHCKLPGHTYTVNEVLLYFFSSFLNSWPDFQLIAGRKGRPSHRSNDLRRLCRNDVSGLYGTRKRMVTFNPTIQSRPKPVSAGPAPAFWNGLQLRPEISAGLQLWVRL